MLPLMCRLIYNGKTQERLKAQHHITVVIINNVNLYKNEIISEVYARQKLMYSLGLLFSCVFVVIYLYYITEVKNVEIIIETF